MSYPPFSQINFATGDCEKILRLALSRGGTFAELYFEKSRTTRIRLSEQKIENALESEEEGVGLRILLQNQTYYAFTSQVSIAALHQLAEQLASLISQRESKNPLALRLPKCSPPLQNRNNQVELQNKIDIVRRCDAGARQRKQSIVNAKVQYRDEDRQIVILNSEGLFRDFNQTRTLLSAEVIAKRKDMLQTGHHPLGLTSDFSIFTEHVPEDVGKLAYEEAHLLLHSKPAPVGTMPVLLSSHAGGTFVHEAVGHALEADCAEEGLSIFSHQKGKLIASPNITVIDDPTLPHAYGSYAMDDEGTPSQKTILVENGILKNYLYDRLQAVKHKQKSTGNGRRESFQNRPLPRMSNIYIAPGNENPDVLLGAIPKGLFVEKMGGGEVDPVSGTFVFEVVKGYLIVNGKKADPVRGATLIGDCRAILEQHLRIGNDFGFSIGTCGKDGQDVPVADAQPTLLIPEITVGGKG